MYLHKISAAMLLCLILISGMYTGTTAAYVHSVSATCENTFTGEVETKVTKETTEQSTTEKAEQSKKSPETGNETYKYALVFALLLSLFLTTILKRKTKKGLYYG